MHPQQLQVLLFFVWGCFRVHGRSIRGRNLGQRQSVLNNNGGFRNPEDMVDLFGTPYIVICSWPETTLDRTSIGELSLLNTETKRKIKFASLQKSNDESSNLSPFADPTCQPKRLRRIGSHGVDVYQNHDYDNPDGPFSWEVAVLNHNQYESIEFFLLNFGNDDVNTQLPTLQQIGCTRLTEGDVHNNLSYNKDKTKLAVTMWYDSYLGIQGQLNFAKSFFRKKPGGDGSLKLVTAGGNVETLTDNLNGPNGVMYGIGKGFRHSIFVAESPNNRVVVVDDRTGTVEHLPKLSDTSSPDNLSREYTATGRRTNTFLITRLDSSFAQASACGVLGAGCNLDFTVLRYNWKHDTLEEVYSGTMEGQATVAIIKEDALYVGNFRIPGIVKVTGFR
ncbi:expressed unknown protein [Seminavis robusta]|uniref:Uncharacterized protein n=1 Tax=Seminavis robusta TaxID=568900 RepID=A0A9N8DJU8_9STRA|nr:expressed unknown protein [Seminavis robusta]|eukprot:Sro198_g084040.1 n/a (391) ;mRNA; f:34681-35853